MLVIRRPPMSMSLEPQWRAEERYMGWSNSSSGTMMGGIWSISSGVKVMLRPMSVENL